MLDLQMLFATCPPGGAIDYRIDIPVETRSPSLPVRLTLADEQVLRKEAVAGTVSLEQSHGQGVWRVIADIVDGSDETTVVESLIVDTVIVEDSDERTRAAVAAAIGRMQQPRIVGASSSGFDDRSNVRTEAVTLSRELHGLEIPEILRLLVSEASSDPTAHWRRLLVLREYLVRPDARPHLPAILAVVADLLCTQRESVIAGTEFDIMVAIALAPGHKWPYFLRVFSQMESSIQLHSAAANGAGPAAVVEQLTRMTPPEYRSMVIQRAEERLELDPGFGRHLSNLYRNFNHRSGLPKLLSALEMDPSYHAVVFDLLMTFDYREATERVRALFPFCAGDPILYVLCSWKDVQSIPLILDRLEGTYREHEVRGIVVRLKQFGDQSLSSRLEELAGRSPADKAAWIRDALRQWA